MRSRMKYLDAYGNELFRGATVLLDLPDTYNKVIGRLDTDCGRWFVCREKQFSVRTGPFEPVLAVGAVDEARQLTVPLPKSRLSRLLFRILNRDCVPCLYLLSQPKERFTCSTANV